MKRKQSISQVRWDLALRYRLIETIAWWEGRLTTGHLMQSFGISRQQASKDINTYLNEHAPKNLTYDRHLKGYKPSQQFQPLFIDGSASAKSVFPLPGGLLGDLDQGRRSLAHWLFNPRLESFGDRLRRRLARGVYYADVFKILCATRDFRAFHRMLVEQGLAVWAGQPFRRTAAELPDDVGRVVRRIEALFPG